jgi:hypothetical protein
MNCRFAVLVDRSVAGSTVVRLREIWFGEMKDPRQSVAAAIGGGTEWIS